MALRPLRRCRLPGCRNLTRNRSGYCDDHERGYRLEKEGRMKVPDPLYVSTRWRKLRALWLAEHPLCERCRIMGAIVPATTVHHKVEVKDGGGELDMANLESLCTSCHNQVHGRRGAG